DLAEAGAALVRQQMHAQVREKAQARVREKLLDLLLPGSRRDETPDNEEGRRRTSRSREKLAAQLDAGLLEDRLVTVEVPKKTDMPFFAAVGVDQLDPDFRNILEQVLPRNTVSREMPIREARKLLLEQETEALIDRTTLAERTVELVENHGIVFLDEIDKICGPQATHGPDVSRQGVQRDLLPIVEGTTVNSKYGPIRTDYILFIAAGAFHTARPSDLMPELQGRFPIRVELSDLSRDDFVRILTEPKHALTRQYAELLRTEGVTLEFTPEGVEALADIAFQVNRTHQNIGARRLHTVLEKVVEEISFDAPDLPDKRVVIDASFVRHRLQDILQREDLSKFIL
ncbi:MAG: ATP-dependent protease ATPase subunit HslU, partial [Gemmataceae bacterium]|nr:ATP-dependent protease ATPase subunit HslU [Gemmataceae bacterium]